MSEKRKVITPSDLKEGQVKVLVQVWSDNHGHDENFGTKPNKPHYVCDKTIEVPQDANLLAAIASCLQQTILARNPNEQIHVMWEKLYPKLEEVRVRIANSEYLCRAVVTF